MFVIQYLKPDGKWQVVGKEYIPEKAARIAESFSNYRVQIFEASEPLFPSSYRKVWIRTAKAVATGQNGLVKRGIQEMFNIGGRGNAMQLLPKPNGYTTPSVAKLIESYNLKAMAA